jgi:peptidoglycan/LPS O-acetylase OafA/YrhL
MAETDRAPSSSTRLTSLDGLRGVAATVVVVYHSTLVARPFLGADVWAWITESPLKLLTLGTESVLVFFVLSGLVVALPARRPGFSWWRYYPSRLARLYLPVWGALALAAVLIALVPRDTATMPEGSWMRDAQYPTVDIGRLLSEASLTRASYDVDNVLWSLRWEVLFSVLLPVFVGVATLLRRRALLWAVLAAAASLVGRIVDVDALVYLPVFLIGTLIAVRLDDVLRWARRPRRRGWWPLFAAVGALLMLASWLARPVVGAGSTADAALWGLAGTGAAMLVLTALGWSRAIAALDSRVAQELGRLSFSLYLVHVPILGTATYLVGAERWPLALALAIPTSFLVAALFHRFVERPSHRFARWIGDRAAALSGRRGSRAS